MTSRQPGVGVSLVVGARRAQKNVGTEAKVARSVLGVQIGIDRTEAYEKLTLLNSR